MMKCLVRCLIENIGEGMRQVCFGRDWIEVPASACRMSDGSPIAEDWPPMWDENGRSVRLFGKVETEVAEPNVILVRLGHHSVCVSSDSVTLIGSRGKPVYRLSVVGDLEPVETT